MSILGARCRHYMPGDRCSQNNACSVVREQRCEHQHLERMTAEKTPWVVAGRRRRERWETWRWAVRGDMLK